LVQLKVTTSKLPAWSCSSQLKLTTPGSIRPWTDILPAPAQVIRDIGADCHDLARRGIVEFADAAHEMAMSSPDTSHSTSSAMGGPMNAVMNSNMSILRSAVASSAARRPAASAVRPAVEDEN
jgi:hypothetical protein